MDGVPQQIQLTLYRIAQEGLRNIWRHAGASEVSIRLCHRDGRLSMEIADDGMAEITGSLAATSAVDPTTPTALALLHQLPLGRWQRLHTDNSASGNVSTSSFLLTSFAIVRANQTMAPGVVELAPPILDEEGNLVPSQTVPNEFFFFDNRSSVFKRTALSLFSPTRWIFLH
ncbi:MAG: hypothetical protein HC828_09460 [Blastochloris sp.]|nr:hypothetical protein [Blastochloris sp.]